MYSPVQIIIPFSIFGDIDNGDMKEDNNDDEMEKKKRKYYF